MQVENPSIRLVGEPTLRYGRKMSGLGIDFSQAATLDNGSTNLPRKPSFTYDDTLPHPSRWSESTQQTRSKKRASISDVSLYIPRDDSSARRRHSSMVSAVLPCPTDIVVSKRPSEVEIQAFVNNKLYKRSARASDDSQNSYGPVTPQDELGPSAGLVNIAGIPGFGESPRKAPLPPMERAKESEALAPKVSRRTSLTQSMMLTLSGRKKETKPPAPLKLAPAIPSIPLKCEVAPVVHHLDRPIARRDNSKTSTCTVASPVLLSTAGHITQINSNGDRPPSRGSLGTLLRTVRKTISRRASKASPLVEPQSRMSSIKTSTPSIKSNAPSFVNVQVETFLEVRSTPSSPYLDVKASRSTNSPSGTATSIASRPQTAPEGRRNDIAFKLHVPPYSHKSTPSTSTSDSPVTGQETRLGGFQIHYTDPWKKKSAFEPSSAYSSSSITTPPSPSRSFAPHRQQKRTPDKLDGLRLVVPHPSTGSLSSLGVNSSYTSSSASPTSVPSWTPMVSLPSPDVSILQAPSVSFMNLEDSPAPFFHSSTSDASLSKKGRMLATPESSKSVLLFTPGKLAMRDPWARVDHSTEQSNKISSKSAGGFQLSRDNSSNRSKQSPSSDNSSTSPRTSNTLQMRRPSRKAVPQIEEEDVFISSIQSQDDKGKTIYTGCRPFRRPSVDQQLSELTITKIPFNMRASLHDLKEGCVDETPNDVLESMSLAGRGASISTEDGEAWYDRVGRPSYPTFENIYTSRRPSYASERSSQSFPSRPTRNEFRRPPFNQYDGMRVSFDAGH